LKKELLGETAGIESLITSLGSINLDGSINIEKLDGNEKDVVKWFESFERIARSNGWTDKVMALKLPCYLKNTALLVWQNEDPEVKDEYKEIKDMIVDKFKVDESIELSYFGRVQRDGESSTDYALTLEKLAKRAFPGINKEQDTLRIYCKGLRGKMRKWVLLSDPKTMKDAMDKAKKVEQYMKEKEIQVVSKVKYEESSSRQYGRPRTQKSHRNLPERIKCFKCGKDGHMTENCRFEKTLIKCYSCGQNGHIAAKCNIGVTIDKKGSSPVLSNFVESCSSSYVFFNIKEKKVKTLVDTGAETSVIDLKLALDLKLKIVKEKTCSLVGANGLPLNVEGWTIVNLNAGKVELRQKLIVVKNLAADLILGSDWCRRNETVISYAKQAIYINNSSIPLIQQNRSKHQFLVNVNKIELKPFENKIEWMEPQRPVKGPVYFEDVALFKNIEFKPGLFEVVNGKVPVIVENKSSKILLIKAGMKLGSIEEISNIKHVNSVQHGPKNNTRKAADLLKFDKNLTEDQKEKLRALVAEYEHIFSKSDNDLGFHNKTKLHIDTGTNRPIKSNPYKIPYAMQDEVKKMIDEMLANGIISKSKSPWSSPIVIVKKRDGSNRFCIDYRKLNLLTTKDNYPVPLIEETLNSLKDSNFFTSLDLASGYWQIALDEETKEKTAFISKEGLFEFERMPFGLSNAVSCFQRTMETVLQGLRNIKVYLDDILIHSKNFAEHLVHLKEVFMRLEEANLKLKPSKCVFAQTETKYLGFDINGEGIKPSSDRIITLLNYPAPSTAKQVKRFLGMASYYRRWIYHFSTIAEPINMLLKKGVKFKWSDECARNFKLIINSLTNPPLLIYPDFNEKFILETDASNVGLGAVLAQKDRTGLNRPIGYASRMLKGAEKNYSATEIECLAIVWAVEHFRQFMDDILNDILNDTFMDDILKLNVITIHWSILIT
jgi:hypothetical protein